MRRILVTFEKGERFPATLLEKKAPETSKIIWDALPCESVVTQSRWSGREVNFKFKSNQRPEKENQTIYTSIGEVVYWRDWESVTSDEDPLDVLAIYYGAEHSRSYRGSEPVNIFAQIDYEYLDQLGMVGERIWRKGTEKIKIEKLDE